MILQAKSATLLTWLITLIAVCSVSPSLDVQPRGVITVGHAAVVDAGMPRESTQLRLRGGRRSIDLSEAVPVTEEDDLVPTKPDRVCASCQALAHAGEDFMRCGWCHATWYCSSGCQRSHWPEHSRGCPPEREHADEIELVEDTRGEDNEGFGGSGPLPEEKRVRRRVMLGEDMVESSGVGGRPGKLPPGWKLCLSCRLPIQVPWIDCPACEAPISSAEYEEDEMYTAADGRVLPMECNAEISHANPGPQENLFRACEEGDVQGIDDAVLAGANVSMTDPSLYDSTPLHYASSNGMATAVSRLLELGADPDAPNEQGETALFWACESGKSQVVKLLLDAGANATCQNEWGETAIDIAASHGSLKIVSLLREHGAEEGDLGKDEEKEEPPREDGAPPQDWEGGADMETETVSALDESDGGVRRGDDDGGLRGRRARPGAKRGGGDDEEADSDQGLGGVDESGANAALEEGMVLGERVRRAPSASQRPFIREAMRREEALRKRDGEGGGKEDEEAVRALFGDDALASIRRERELMKEDDDARARAGKREEATWERLADDGSVYAQMSAPSPEEMDRDIRRITECVAAFNMDTVDPDRKRREEMASLLRDAAADFARRAAERRAMIEERGLREADVPAVELPTAPKVEVEGNLLQMGREGGAGAGDDSMAEEEADEEIF